MLVGLRDRSDSLHVGTLNKKWRLTIGPNEEWLSRGEKVKRKIVIMSIFLKTKTVYSYGVIIIFYIEIITV